MSKPSMLVISHVKPFSLSAGQNVRVFNKLIALRSFFNITFLTFALSHQVEATRSQLEALVDKALVLPSVTQRNAIYHVLNGTLAEIRGLKTGLKRSNYLIGQRELTEQRLSQSLPSLNYKMVLYEYWHAVGSTQLFQRHGIPCILDMHNILWKSYERQRTLTSYLQAWQKRSIRKYRAEEEIAWKVFDGLITINAAEHEYVRSVVPDRPLFYAPMGINMEVWPYLWSPAQPARIGYYGGLGSAHNQQYALRSYHGIMPRVWERQPDTEFWLIGSNPPPDIQKLARDRRVRVTGFVERPHDVLKTMSAVLCPWSGTYGFRSRVVETMALGAPVVATPDAVYGMEIENGHGILLGETDEQLSEHTLRLIHDKDFAKQQSIFARHLVEEKYSFATYERLARELHEYALGSSHLHSDSTKKTVSQSL